MRVVWDKDTPGWTLTSELKVNTEQRRKLNLVSLLPLCPVEFHHHSLCETAMKDLKLGPVYSTVPLELKRSGSTLCSCVYTHSSVQSILVHPPCSPSFISDISVLPFPFPKNAFFFSVWFQKCKVPLFIFSLPLNQLPACPFTSSPSSLQINPPKVTQMCGETKTSRILIPGVWGLALWIRTERTAVTLVWSVLFVLLKETTRGRFEEQSAQTWTSRELDSTIFESFFPTRVLLV